MWRVALAISEVDEMLNETRNLNVFERMFPAGCIQMTWCSAQDETGINNSFYNKWYLHKWPAAQENVFFTEDVGKMSLNFLLLYLIARDLFHTSSFILTHLPQSSYA